MTDEICVKSYFACNWRFDTLAIQPFPGCTTGGGVPWAFPSLSNTPLRRLTTDV
jgi:hypothetical protein